ncbi:MarR family winged helix-turn-helix transcriptional regulator [Roseovarius rhodophyticola]|uniref:MarR family transcriptional regulator n=1 Tax=Roseovarius rhodophyticola TaxID=3080827 RepID=A0ABZ2TIL9_9RHOB|nr:MarR family transcriptional regulator [Roseovarius sp. W115]MDV2929880.1 MarR family transcriptional regulator [Roseovarius sp. W115]
MSNLPQQEAMWYALSRGYSQARGALEGALKSANLPTLDVFDALNALVESETQLTAKALETALLMPQYGVSRLLDRMEKDGLVARVANPGDQRSKLLKVTESGADTHIRMKRVRDASLVEFFGPRARPGQLMRMTRLLGLLDDTAEAAD